MYKIFILDVALLNTFLAAADTDYVNAIVGKGNSHLLINQAEVFNVLDLKTITTEPDCHVRIPKVILAKLIRSGSIELRISDGIVEISFQTIIVFCSSLTFLSFLVSFLRFDLYLNFVNLKEF